MISKYGQQNIFAVENQIVSKAIVKLKFDFSELLLKKMMTVLIKNKFEDRVSIKDEHLYKIVIQSYKDLA